MNISGISNKSLLGQLLRLPLRFIPSSTVLPILQGKLRGYKWIAGSSNAGCWLGSYEFHKQRVIGSSVSPGTIVFDIGAHVGFYSLLFSVLVGQYGKVFAFEPYPPNVRYLQKHLSLNRTQNVEILEFAVSDISASGRFTPGKNASTGRLTVDGALTVTQVTVDELIYDRNFPVPNYIKLDIEGTELKALNGARTVLEEYRPTVFLATHSREIHSKCCLLLNELEYNLYPIGRLDISETDEIIAVGSV